MTKESSDNFDPKSAIKEVSDNFVQSDKFANHFINAYKKSKDMDKALRGIIKELMEKDPDTRGIIVGMIRKVNEEDWKNLIKKICRDAKSVIIFILGIVVTICVQKFFQ
jgi:hypothetical protein